jgi:NADH:ubiquinone oxidoreductase subunit E
MEPRSVEQILDTYDHGPRYLVEVLQDIQGEHGYLSEKAIRAVSTHLRVPLIEAYRVANFYKAFSLVPRGRHVLTVCMGTACHVRGAPTLLDEVAGQLGVEPGQTSQDGLFTLERVNCLGACALGPIVVLDGHYHRNMTPNKLRKLARLVRQAENEVPADA